MDQSATECPSDLPQAVLSVVADHLSHPNPFDTFTLDRDPIGCWCYVLKEMKATRWERHMLLRSIIAVRVAQGGRYDPHKGQQILEDVLAGKYDQ
jgi:hypothetical protein